jgi:hypothetical protein
MQELFSHSVPEVSQPTKVAGVHIDGSLDFRRDNASVRALENQINFALLRVSEMVGKGTHL